MINYQVVEKAKLKGSAINPVQRGKECSSTDEVGKEQWQSLFAHLLATPTSISTLVVSGELQHLQLTICNLHRKTGCKCESTTVSPYLKIWCHLRELHNLSR